MRYIITSLLLLNSVLAIGQNNKKLSLVLQIQPELTFHKTEYFLKQSEKSAKSTFNIGFTASIQYKLSERLFVDAGLGLITRQLKTKVAVNQSLLPPPYYDTVAILYIAQSVSFRTLQLPLGVGYSLIKTKKTNVFARCVFVPDFLLSTKYDVNNYPGFNKNYWQGYSINLGFGFNLMLNKDIQLANSLTYSMLNSVAKDDYTHRQGAEKTTLTHQYLQLSSGVKINL